MLAHRRTLGGLADRDHFRDRNSRARFAIAVRHPDSNVCGQRLTSRQRRLTGYVAWRHRNRISGRNRSE